MIRQRQRPVNNQRKQGAGERLKNDYAALIGSLVPATPVSNMKVQLNATTMAKQQPNLYSALLGGSNVQRGQDAPVPGQPSGQEPSSSAQSDKRNYKSEINEAAQKMRTAQPEYRTIFVSNDVFSPMFLSTLCFDGKRYTGDRYPTKTQAENSAAKRAVREIESRDAAFELLKKMSLSDLVEIVETEQSITASRTVRVFNQPKPAPPKDLTRYGVEPNPGPSPSQRRRLEQRAQNRAAMEGRSLRDLASNVLDQIDPSSLTGLPVEHAIDVANQVDENDVADILEEVPKPAGSQKVRIARYFVRRWCRPKKTSPQPAEPEPPRMRRQASASGPSGRVDRRKERREKWLSEVVAKEIEDKDDFHAAKHMHQRLLNRREMASVAASRPDVVAIVNQLEKTLGQYMAGLLSNVEWTNEESGQIVEICGFVARHDLFDRVLSKAEFSCLLIRGCVERQPGPKMVDVVIGSGDAPYVISDQTPADQVSTLLGGGAQVIAVPPPPEKPSDPLPSNVAALVPRYGKYGGPDYTAGQTGLTAAQTLVAANQVPPSDRLDALFRLHDIAYAVAADDEDRIRADKALITGIDMLFRADPDQANWYGRAAQAAFRALDKAIETGIWPKAGAAPSDASDPVAKMLNAARNGLAYAVPAYGMIDRQGRQSGPIVDKAVSIAKAAGVPSVVTNQLTPNNPIGKIEDAAKTMLIKQVLGFVKDLTRDGDVEANPGPGWVRDLTREGVEPNPGPGFKELGLQSVRAVNPTHYPIDGSPDDEDKSAKKYRSKDGRDLAPMCLDLMSRQNASNLINNGAALEYVRVFSQSYNNSVNVPCPKVFDAIETIIPSAYNAGVPAVINGNNVGRSWCTFDNMQAKLMHAYQWNPAMKKLADAFGEGVTASLVSSFKETATLGPFKLNGWTTRMQQEGSTIANIMASVASMLYRSNHYRIAALRPYIDYQPPLVGQKQYDQTTQAWYVDPTFAPFNYIAGARVSATNDVPVGRLMVMSSADFSQYYNQIQSSADIIGPLAVNWLPTGYAADGSVVSSTTTNSDLAKLALCSASGPRNARGATVQMTDGAGVPVTQQVLAVHAANYECFDGASTVVVVVPSTVRATVAGVASGYTNGPGGAQINFWSPATPGVHFVDLDAFAAAWASSLDNPSWAKWTEYLTNFLGAADDEELTHEAVSMRTYCVPRYYSTGAFDNTGAFVLANEPGYDANTVTQLEHRRYPTGHEATVDDLQGLLMRMPQEYPQLLWAFTSGLVCRVKPVVQRSAQAPLPIIDHLASRITSNIYGEAYTCAWAKSTLGCYVDNPMIPAVVGNNGDRYSKWRNFLTGQHIELPDVCGFLDKCVGWDTTIVEYCIESSSDNPLDPIGNTNTSDGAGTDMSGLICHDPWVTFFMDDKASFPVCCTAYGVGKAYGTTFTQIGDPSYESRLVLNRWSTAVPTSNALGSKVMNKWDRHMYMQMIACNTEWTQTSVFSINGELTNAGQRAATVLMSAGFEAFDAIVDLVMNAIAQAYAANVTANIPMSVPNPYASDLAFWKVCTKLQNDASGLNASEGFNNDRYNVPVYYTSLFNTGMVATSLNTTVAFAGVYDAEGAFARAAAFRAKRGTNQVSMGSSVGTTTVAPGTNDPNVIN